MRYRTLGKSGILVSELCMGAMTFGGEGYWRVIGSLPFAEAKKLVDMTLDAGVNFFDTANVYSHGQSEEILGKALGERRKDIILATKVRGRMGSGMNDVGLSRRHIIASCEDSLRRLGTDYLDLYIVHSFDFVTPLDETLRALTDLVRQGKVRYLGCSNYAAWQLMKALCISYKHNLEHFISLQAYYSLTARDVELELVPLCLDQGLGLTPWSPLSGGFLSGKFRRGMPRPEGARRSKEEGHFLPVDEEKGYRILDELDVIAKEHSATAAQAALNYLLQKPAVSSIIIGATKPEQLEDNLKSVEWDMTPEEVKRLDDLSSPTRLYPHWMFEYTKRDRLSPQRP